ncbi:MAG TPA: hypothetical protein VI612_00245 [Candidatus Nanoarchaeia archaeon]|nr:hypothetical protein [Candidatus Nanoarchaeia archaeon]
MEAFTQLGRIMAKELNLSAKDLETRVNSLGTEFPQEQVRAIVTGYIDASLEANRWNTVEVYTLLHGFGRWLYNGTFDSVRKRVLDKIAQSSRSAESIFECLEGNQEAINYIAEARIEKTPDFAHAHYKGEKRPEMLRRIIEKHSQREEQETRDTVISCMRELNDNEGLRALAYRCLETDFGLAEHLLLKYGTREDKLKLAEIAKKTGKIEKAGKLITEHGTKEELEAFIREIRSTDIRTAYELSRMSGPKELYKEIKQQMIQEHPEVAEGIFYAKPYEDGHPQLNDQAGMLEVAKRFAELKRHSSAIRAYGIAYCFDLAREQQEQIRTEVRQHALEMLRAGQKIPEVTMFMNRDFIYAVQDAVIAYFTEGGNPLTADEHIREEVLPSLNAQLARALAQLPGEKATNRAYARLIHLGEKIDKKENELLAELRERILQQPYAANFFADNRDQEGMRLYIDRNIESNPKIAYSVAIKHLREEEAMIKTRQALIQAATAGRIPVKEAFTTFEETKDQLGIAELQQALAPGIERRVAETLLARPERRHY